MAFRYLIYRTDYGNTVVRESALSGVTGNEVAFFTDFVIPVNQPLYLWKYDTGNILPNSETNINNWLAFVNPPSPDEPVNYEIFTGYTASTQTTIDGIEADIIYLSGETDGKYDKIVAVTGNVPIFGASGNALVDSGYDITDLLGGVTGATPIGIFTGYTASTETRLDGIEADIIYLSGQTNLKLNISTFNIYSADTKTYIDSVAAGLDPKQSVRVGTTLPLTGATYVASGGTSGTGSFTSAPSTVDGIALVNGNRILVKNQTDKKQNGVYVRISSTVWHRSSDMDGNPTSEVSAGNYVFVETGSTLAASGWVVEGDGVLTVNVDNIQWIQFSAANSYLAGVGITINGNTISFNGGSVAGNNLSWNGSQLNVVVTGGTLGTALNGKLDKTTFNSYTGTTETRISGIEDDVVYLSGQTASKVGNTKFNSYTGTTETRISGIEDDVVYLSGQTAARLRTTTFNAYTGATKSDEICLIRTGSTGIDINTIAPTAVIWNGQLKTSTVFSWTGGSGIFVTQTGEYEVTYNVPIVHTGTNNLRSYGSNLILNNTTVIDRTFAGENTSRVDSVGNLALPSIVISLTSGNRIDLVAFRAALAGTTNTRPDATILIKKKNTLQ